MASANDPLFEEQFLCSVCLEVFTDPVSTPCGHNYCKHCIADFSQCPLCRVSIRASELRVNTEFRDMLEVFKKTTGDKSRPGEVPCDLCPGIKCKALKSCLICLASYCDTHLKPHHTVRALKWHKLINPVESLEDRVCKKHNKVMEFFCKKDQSCVCVVCLKDGHEMHPAISLEEEFKERKTKLDCMKKQVNHTLSEKCIMAQRIQNSMGQVRQKLERTKAETVQAFAGLVASIETKKVKLIELLEEQQRAADQQAEAIIRQLQLEIDENRQTSIKLEELSKSEDDFRLLHGLPSVSTPSNTTRRFSVQHFLHVETVRSGVAKIKETLNEQMENIIREVNSLDEEESVAKRIDTQSENLFDDELGKIQNQYATEVTLDHNTAHPSLILSDDRKQVRDGGTKRKVPNNPMRFDSLHFVFGNQGVSSGRFYYEVVLEGQTGWEVGVARDSISRKGLGFSLSPENGWWTLGLYWGRCQANANPPVTLHLSKEPKKVGVFVDYEGGLVSFYDVDTRALIYSFTGCAFTASAPFRYNWLGLKSYTGTQEKTTIYPIFRPSPEEGSDSSFLQITPVHRTKGK